MDLKKQIVAFLEKNTEYEWVDDSLIDEYVANVDFAKQARELINQEGIVGTEIRKTSGKNPQEYEIQKKNPAFDVYNKALDNMTKIVTKLGISPSDRIKLKILAIEQEDKDDLSDFD